MITMKYWNWTTSEDLSHQIPKLTRPYSAFEDFPGPRISRKCGQPEQNWISSSVVDYCWTAHFRSCGSGCSRCSLGVRDWSCSRWSLWLSDDRSWIFEWSTTPEYSTNTQQTIHVQRLQLRCVGLFGSINWGHQPPWIPDVKIKHQSTESKLTAGKSMQSPLSLPFLDCPQKWHWCATHNSNINQMVLLRSWAVSNAVKKR